MYLDEQIKTRVEEKLKRLQQLRPLPAMAVKKLQEQFQIEMTYNSNGIEGNSLTLKETFWVVNEGITIKGKPLKDHLEAKDHHEALEYVYGLIEHGKQQTISEQLVRSLHQLVMKKTDEDWAGKYRNAEVIIGGADHKPPQAIAVPTKMAELIRWWREQRKKLHPLELAALLHHKLVYIHPFFDGNGRTARLVMNVVLMQAGYPLAIILKNDRKKYYRVLDRADARVYEPWVRFVAQTVERSLDIYLKVLVPVKEGQGQWVPLAKATKQVDYSAKYLNLLARKGKLAAHKEGRNWLTTVEAIKQYMSNRQRQRRART